MPRLNPSRSFRNLVGMKEKSSNGNMNGNSNNSNDASPDWDPQERSEEMRRQHQQQAIANNNWPLPQQPPQNTQPPLPVGAQHVQQQYSQQQQQHHNHHHSPENNIQSNNHYHHHHQNNGQLAPSEYPPTNHSNHSNLSNGSKPAHTLAPVVSMPTTSGAPQGPPRYTLKFTIHGLSHFSASPDTDVRSASFFVLTKLKTSTQFTEVEDLPTPAVRGASAGMWEWTYTEYGVPDSGFKLTCLLYRGEGVTAKGRVCLGEVVVNVEHVPVGWAGMRREGFALQETKAKGGGLFGKLLGGKKEKGARVEGELLISVENVQKPAGGLAAASAGGQALRTKYSVQRLEEGGGGQKGT